MKKILSFLAAVILLSSCDMGKIYEPHTNERGVTQQRVDNDIKKFTFEGHEYLRFEESVYCGVSIAVVHSASCPCHDKE